MKNDFSGASLGLFFVLIMCNCSISWNICSFEFDRSKISSIYKNKSKTLFYKSFKEVGYLFCKESWKSFRAEKPHINAKSLSPDEKLVSFMVSSLRGVCA